MSLIIRPLSILICYFFLQSCASNTTNPLRTEAHGADQISVAIQSFVATQRTSGNPNYAPQWAYIVDPSTQRLMVMSVKTGKIHETLRCGTGKLGLGFKHAQTPPGIFTMGGVRIARNGNAAIQTGDSKKGVSGIYAEILYPPTYHDASLRGYVPNGVVIHSYNPEASEMLRQRRAQKMIGRIPCTTGCPVPDIDEAYKLIPYLKSSAGKFDPTANPNANLRNLINQGMVKVYQRNQLGDPIYILNRQ